MIGTASLTLYVYGELRYRDTFGKDWATKYRLIHGGNEGTGKRTGKDGDEGWLLKPDAEGNETT